MTVEATKQNVYVDAVLFDMDGTLLDSTPGVLAAWEIFAKDYNLGDFAEVAHQTHGRRLYDSFKEYCNIQDEQKLLDEINRFEDEVIAGGPVALPGAVSLMDRLNELGAKWTIATSASRSYALKALERAGLPLPPIEIITSIDVPRGKPHPDPYEAAAALLAVKPENCIVVEDAISGITAGKAAGSRVLAVCTSTTRDVLLSSDVQPDFIIPDLTGLNVDVSEGRLKLELEL